MLPAPTQRKRMITFTAYSHAYPARTAPRRRSPRLRAPPPARPAVPSLRYQRSPRVRSSAVLRVAVVGSGPSGCYTAQSLVQRDPEVLVDVLDRLPCPYGLVRYGVAP